MSSMFTNKDIQDAKNVRCVRCPKNQSPQVGMAGAEHPAYAPYPDPTPAMLEDPLFNAIWNAIKGWDIGVRNVFNGLHTGAMGSHARAIYDAVCGEITRQRDSDPSRQIPIENNPGVRFEGLPEPLRKLYYTDPAVHIIVSAYLHDRISRDEMMSRLVTALSEQAASLREQLINYIQWFGAPPSVVPVGKK